MKYVGTLYIILDILKGIIHYNEQKQKLLEDRAPAGPPLLLGTEGWRAPLVAPSVDKVILLGQLVSLLGATGAVLVLSKQLLGL